MGSKTKRTITPDNQSRTCVTQFVCEENGLAVGVYRVITASAESWKLIASATGSCQLVATMNYRIRLMETEEGWSVSCLDLPGCHSQGETRPEAVRAIQEAIHLWLEVEAEESGIKSCETTEVTV